MAERRFRDMRLTTDDMWSRIGDHIGRNYDPDGYGYSKQCARLEARAKRLLPLWREWGLLELGKRWLQEGVECEKRNAKDREWLANRNQTKR